MKSRGCSLDGRRARRMSSPSRMVTPAAMADIAQWSRSIYADVAGSVAYTPGRVLHLWHGDMASRNYIARLQILLDNAYDPTQDVRIDEDGCWQWCSAKPALHQQVRAYFTARGIAAREELADGTPTG